MGNESLSKLLNKWENRARNINGRKDETLSIYQCDSIKLEALAQMYNLPKADVVATLLHEALNELERKCLTSLETKSFGLNTGNERLLVCTSTTGQGEIPDTLMHLYCQLKDRLPLMPDKEYGVIALGDSSYDAFAEAGCLMDSLFQELKMKRLGEILFIDACETMAPCEDATHWLQDWTEAL